LANSRYGCITNVESTIAGLKKLIQYLREISAADMTLENLGRRLAIIDRLEESVVWSRKWVSKGHNSLTSFQEVNMHALAAKYLMHSDTHASCGDMVLSKEWLLVSQLCEATIYFPFKHHRSFFAPAEKDHAVDRPNACKTILAMLTELPELLSGDPQQIFAHYKFKLLVAENEKIQGAELQQAQLLCAEQTDPRLRRLLQYRCTVLANLIDEIRRLYEHSASETELYKTLLSQADG
jgi:hypothetical protein